VFAGLVGFCVEFFVGADLAAGFAGTDGFWVAGGAVSDFLSEAGAAEEAC
jgi:hypothetical protein